MSKYPDNLHEHVPRNPTSESAQPVAQEPLYVIFDGPPSHESGRFVEVENERGESVKVGEWRRLPDGLWSLGPLYAAPVAQTADARDAQILKLLGEMEGRAKVQWENQEHASGQMYAIRELRAAIAAIQREGDSK